MCVKCTPVYTCVLKTEPSEDEVKAIAYVKAEAGRAVSFLQWYRCTERHRCIYEWVGGAWGGGYQSDS